MPGKPPLFRKGFRPRDKGSRGSKEPNIIKEVVEAIVAEGGPPSETTSEKIISKARKILGGGVELRGGGRAVMKKGGKV